MQTHLVNLTVKISLVDLVHFSSKTQKPQHPSNEAQIDCTTCYNKLSNLFIVFPWNLLYNPLSFTFRQTVSDRFYQALYEKLVDPELKTSSKQVGHSPVDVGF